MSFRTRIAGLLDRISNRINPPEESDYPFIIEMDGASYLADRYDEIVGPEGMPVGIVFHHKDVIRRAMHCPYIIHIDPTKVYRPPPTRITFEGYT